MKIIKTDGTIFEGTEEELKSYFKEEKKKEADFTPRKKNFKSNIIENNNSEFEQVHNQMIRTGEPVTTALKKIMGYAGGKMTKKFKAWLVDNKKTTINGTYNKDNTELFGRAYKIYQSDKKQGVHSALKLITGKDNNYQLKKFKQYLEQQGETGIRLKSKGWKQTVNQEKRIIMSEIAKKGSELFKTGMTRQDAMRQAQTMIRKKPNLPVEAFAYENAAYHKATATTPLQFPKFETVDEKFHTILEGILKNFYNNNGALSFSSDAYSLGIQNREEWKQFIEELTARNEAVTKYFNIKGKYTVSYNMAQFKRG